MNQIAFDPALLAETSTNGNGHNHAPAHHGDSYQAAFAAGAASAHEAAFREGYQAGFAAGFAQAQQESAPNSTSTSAAPRGKTADGLLKRLRGLPCAQCGVSMYSDESICRCCGTTKAARAERSGKSS